MDTEALWLMDVGCRFAIDTVLHNSRVLRCKVHVMKHDIGSSATKERRGRGSLGITFTCYHASLHFWFASITLSVIIRAHAHAFALHPSAPRVICTLTSSFLFFPFFSFSSSSFLFEVARAASQRCQNQNESTHPLQLCKGPTSQIRMHMFLQS